MISQTYTAEDWLAHIDFLVKKMLIFTGSLDLNFTNSLNLNKILQNSLKFYW